MAPARKSSDAPPWTISYSVYLWGLVAIEIVRKMGHDRYHLPAFAVAIAIGSASYFIIERPFQSLGSRLISRSKEQVRVPVPIAW